MAGIKVSSSFDRQANLPIDAGFVVATTTIRDAIASGIRFDGLSVYCLADTKTYQLQGGIANSNWKDASGGGSSSVADALTAHAGGGQGSALALTASVNRITTVATAGDSVKLPAAVAGLQVIVVNDGGKPVDIFPSTGEVINNASANAAFSITPAMRRLTFICFTTGTWRVNLIGTPDVFGSLAVPRSIVIATGIVAASSHMSITTQHQMIWVKGSVAGENIITASPPIQAGLSIGQVMEIFGQDTTDYITLLMGSSGIDLNGDWSSSAGSWLRLVWNGSVWFETMGRRV